MTWIRGPLWDIGWIWSGPIIGVALLLTPVQWRMPFFAVGCCLQMAHHFSPVAMAWTSAEFRGTMLERWPMFIALPFTVIAVIVATGAITALGYTTYPFGRPYSLGNITSWTNPLPIMALLYSVANAYHFGGQWYGVSRLYLRRRSFTHRAAEHMRWAWIAFALVVIIIIPLVPIYIPQMITLMGPAAVQFWMHYIFYWTKYWPSYSDSLSLWFFGAISIQHWITDLGLTQAATRSTPRVCWWLLPALMVAGTCGLYIDNTSLTNVIAGHLMIRTSHWLWPVVYSAVIATGCVHFIYSRQAWRHGTPFMRAVLYDNHASTAQTLIASPRMAAADTSKT